MARRHLVEDHAEGKNIAAGVDHPAERLLGRHVCDRAQRRAWAGEIRFGHRRGAADRRGFASSGRHDFREAEIEDLGLAAIGDEDVCRLDVAMDDAFAVGGVEGVGHADRQVEQSIDRERAHGDAVLQGDALQKLHRDKGPAVVLVDVVNRADVRVVERTGGAGLALEALESRMVGGDVVGQEFQRDGAAELGVLGLVNDAHPAAAEPFGNAVMGYGFTDERIVCGHWEGMLGGSARHVNHSLESLVWQVADPAPSG